MIIRKQHSYGVDGDDTVGLARKTFGHGAAGDEGVPARGPASEPSAITYPAPVVPTLPGIVTSLLSDVPYATSSTTPVGYAAYYPGATVGTGANVRFTAVFASGQGVGTESHLILSNGGIATLATTSTAANGVVTATYVYAVTAQDTATTQLSVTGIERDGTTYASAVAANLAIDPTIESPSDLLYSGEWYIHGTYGVHADKVWGDYTGKGVTVAVFDNGIEYGHEDLDNVDVSMGYNPDYDTHNDDGVTRNGDSSQEVDSAGNDHGTAVAGLIGASRNGLGAVGVAYDATLYSIFNYYGHSRPADAPYDGTVNAFLDAAKHADVMNNSWGVGNPFGADFAGELKDVGQALAIAATEGRGGLGTIVVQSAGNDAFYGNDTNTSNYTNNPYSITVGSSTGLGRKFSYSMTGASVLVAAPGGGMITTDRAGEHGYSNGSYTDAAASWFSGTSAAAPVVSGVVALILEANPHLGARDVQEILAYSAAPNETGAYDYYATFFNGAGNWNNGGLRANNSVGFGLVDARAAVRLAETWTTQKTWNNVVDQSASIAPTGPDASTVLTDNGQVVMSQVIHLDSQQTIDHVQLRLDIDTTRPEFLSVVLTSPDGTQSVLLNALGYADDGYYNYTLDSTGGLHWTFGSTQFMGEMAAGDWTVTVYTTSYTATEYTGYFANDSWTARDTGYPLTTTITHAELTVHGDAVDPNTTYFYTDAYARAFHGTSLTDADGGYDTINAAAASGPVTVILDGSGPSSIGGVALVIGDDHVWRVFGGDGGDTLVAGDTLPTLLSGMRGADTLTGGSATTMLVGGAGDDMLTGRAGFAIASYAGAAGDFAMALANGQWTIAGGAEGRDTCVGIDWATFSDGVFGLNDDGTTTRLTGTVCDLSLDPALGLGLAETAAGFLAYSGALAAYADDLSSLVITDATELTLDVAQLLGAAPLLDLLGDVALTLADTAAAIGGALADLDPLGADLTAVSLTDAGTIHLTQAELPGAAGVLAKLTGDFSVAVAQDDGGTIVYAHRGTAQITMILDAEGHKTSVTTLDPSALYQNVVRTYSDGQLVSAEFNAIAGHDYTHVVRQYEDGHVVLDTRDGFTGGDMTMRITAFDLAGTVREVSTTYTGRDYQTLSLGYDADGQLETRTRDGVDGPISSVTGYYADGISYATLTTFDNGTSRLVGSTAGDLLSLALAETVRGRSGADSFVVAAEEPNGRILDFSRAAGDTIDLSHLFASEGDAHFIKDAAFGGHAGEIRFDHLDSGVLVQIDLDGDAHADASFAMNGVRVLATDFVF